MQYLALPEKSCATQPTQKQPPEKNQHGESHAERSHADKSTQETQETNCFWLVDSSAVVGIQMQPPKQKKLWHLNAGVHPNACAEDNQFIYLNNGLILASHDLRQRDLPEKLPPLPTLLARPWLPCQQALITDNQLFYLLDLALLEALCH